MNLFIGCSSHSDIDNKFIDDADYISKRLSEMKYDLIIGGISKDGIFGKILYNFQENKRHIKLYTLKLYNEDVSIFDVSCNYVSDTFERQKSIYNDADKILILPGGTGTLSELFGMLEDKRTFDNDKEIIIYNQDGYYYDLIKFITKFIKYKFNDNTIFNYVKVFNDKDDLIKYMEV